jgi:hypothetical protein
MVSRGSALTDTGGSDLLALVCGPDNDLYRALVVNRVACTRYATTTDAVAAAQTDAGVLVLADGYPSETTLVDVDLFARANEKNLRLYIEYPRELLGTIIGEPLHVHSERAVVASDIFGDQLAKTRVLGIHDCSYVPIETGSPWMVLATVAGFDTAVYGIPSDARALLFEYGPTNSLIATTKLSQMITGRYAPHEAWPIIWNAILAWVNGGTPLPNLRFGASVHSSYGPADALPEDHEKNAVLRGVNWYKNARMLVHESWLSRLAKAEEWKDRVAPAPDRNCPVGDGSWGVLEGQSSRVRFDGSQYTRWYARADCNCESAMAFALHGFSTGDRASGRTAASLLDFVYTHSEIQQGPRADPASPSFGLLGWDTRPEGLGIYYGDDNARAILGTITASAALGSRRWDESLVKAILGNFRTSGKNGFRGGRLEEEGLSAEGWEGPFQSELVHLAPHYESWLWATYLWLYNKTGYGPLLERTRTGLQMMMECYPDRWQWTNGIQQERARLALPLAWLVRTDDTPEHRGWLRRILEDLLEKQDDCGAIREEIGTPTQGRYGPPRSNADYGKHEATLVQANGDPVCDLLYTTNFALLSLREAWAATGDDYYRLAEDRLAEFICRIQAQSDTRPEFDGAWFRAFDFRRWDYWASNADIGWGPWSTETGWTQGWIVAVLALRVLKTNLWELTNDSGIGDVFASYRKSMLPID